MIDKTNIISLAAHLKAGFKIVSDKEESKVRSLMMNEGGKNNYMLSY